MATGSGLGTRLNVLQLMSCIVPRLFCNGNLVEWPQIGKQNLICSLYCRHITDLAFSPRLQMQLTNNRHIKVGILVDNVFSRVKALFILLACDHFLPSCFISKIK